MPRHCVAVVIPKVEWATVYIDFRQGPAKKWVEAKK